MKGAVVTEIDALANRTVGWVLGLVLLVGAPGAAVVSGQRAAVPGGVLLGLGGALLLVLTARLRVWLQGTVLHRRGLRSRSVDLAEAVDAAVQGNRGGQAQLVVRDGRAQLRVVLLSATDYVKGSLPPQQLRAIAGPLTGRTGCERAVVLLGQQADHLAAGRDLPSSPLAAYAGDAVTKLAKGAGAAGAGGSLLG